MRVLGFMRARDAEEGDAEGLDEAGRGQSARQRQHRDGHGHQHGHFALGNGRAAEQSLEHHPFRDEAVEGRQGGDRGRAHQEEEGRARHPLDEPAHLLHVARVGGVEHGARAQEEQALEARMVDGVVETAHEAQHGQRGKPVAQEHHPRPHADEDDADVLDGVIREQALEVVLHQRVEHTQERRDGAESQHEAAPPGGAAAEQPQAEEENAVDPQLDHDAGHERRDVAGRRRMRAGQPHVERHQACLGAEADQREDEDQALEAGRERRGVLGQRREVTRAIGRQEEKERRQDESEPELRHAEVPVARAHGLGLIRFGHDE